MERVKFLGKYTCFATITLVAFLGGIGFASNGSVDSADVAVAGDRVSVRAMGGS